MLFNRYLFVVLVTVFMPMRVFSLTRTCESSADLIVFSYNRPLQLYALLESIYRYMHNLNKIHVLYRVNDNEYDRAYNDLINQFPSVHFVKQGKNPRNDFKPLLLKCFYNTPTKYILFAVDDDLIKDDVDVQECCNVLEETNSYCFFLRLGENITEQYGQPSVCLTAPPCVEVRKDIFKYCLNDGCYGDWRYPHNVDMTLFKKADIEAFFKNNGYHSPNTLESNWSAQVNLEYYGLFYKTSKMFSLPINCVQEDWVNGCIGTYSASDLLKLWQDGYGFNLDQYAYMKNSCPFVSEKPKVSLRCMLNK